MGKRFCFLAFGCLLIFSGCSSSKDLGSGKSLTSVPYVSNTPSAAVSARGGVPTQQRGDLRVSANVTQDKKNSLTLMVEVVNLSPQPVRISPSQVHFAVGDFFLLQPIYPAASSPKKVNPNRALSTLSGIVNRVPYNDPYGIMSGVGSLSSLATSVFKPSSTSNSQSTVNVKNMILKDKMVPAGYGVRGYLFYDTTDFKDVRDQPIRVTVQVGGEEFHFQFSGA